MEPSPDEVTQMLRAWRNGDQAALENVVGQAENAPLGAAGFIEEAAALEQAAGEVESADRP